MVIKPLKENDWVLRLAYRAFVAEFAYIARLRHPYYQLSDTLCTVVTALRSLKSGVREYISPIINFRLYDHSQNPIGIALKSS